MTAAQPDRIDILVDQVGRLTEGISELRTAVQTGFAGVQDSFSELRAVSERQEQNITRLVGIVEALIQRDEQR